VRLGVSPGIRFAPGSGHSRFRDDADRCDEAGTGDIPLERTTIEEVAAENLDEIRDRLGLPARTPPE
jgi:hypothetical protein